jgi:two-component system, NtrC family, response regulator AtoC
MILNVPPIVGVSTNIQNIRELIRHVAGSGLNVVIIGESGVGKEVVAQNLYKHSPRVGGPFIKVNCAALPEGLLESELFGYEPGAFTGADRRKKGKFELAHGGVLLLDEIGDMSISLQAKLLHVLQDSTFSPLGSEAEMKSDTWIIAATNHELEKDINKGSFREDLYYRLNIIRIQIAPLRSRPEDIPPLIEHFLKEYSGKYNSLEFRVNENLLQRLSAYHWPGNVRELQNVLKRMMVLGDCEKILDELEKSVYAFADQAPVARNDDKRKYESIPDFAHTDFTNMPDLTLKKLKKNVLQKAEKELITYVLNQAKWNKSLACRIMKISYKTLLYKMEEFSIFQPNKSEAKMKS